MDLTNINNKEEMLSNEVLDNIFAIEDEIEREREIIACTDKAKILGCKTEFVSMIKVYKSVLKKAQQKQLEVKTSNNNNGDNLTLFGYFDDGKELNCGNWIADYSGIRTFGMFGEVLACYHPILPIKRLINKETGEEHVILAFYRNKRWKTVKVPKTVISSANKIVGLSAQGIAVTSENAKYLVKYLLDIENLNEGDIEVVQSTSKLGWHDNVFVPYDNKYLFDGEAKFKSLYEAITEHGSRDKWYEHIKMLRKHGKPEVKFMIAASLASVLVGKFKALPFIVDLWGFTEGGKTVSLMIACSVWANPDESQYIGDLKTTDVALETKADVLNSLPMILDDTSQTSARVRDNFEGIVYQLCSGKGKSRSNKDLGINRENHWRNCFITNGERPLNSYVNQGGAINRILEIECSEKIFDNPQETVNIVKENYGFLGKDFIEVIKNIDMQELEKIRSDFQKKLNENPNVMQKQSISLSIILTADKIAEEYIFHDGVTINPTDYENALSSIEEVSDNERCYEFLLDKISMNDNRFNPNIDNIEKWGITEPGYAVFFVQAFKDLCKSGGYNAKSFLSWADRKGIIDTQGDSKSKVKKIDGKSYRCIFLRTDVDLEQAQQEEFVQADLTSIPFD